jgi:tyrosine-protein phosphatase SIW14
VRVSRVAAWATALTLSAFMIAVPYYYYRYNYTFAKRLRPVDDGKVYRCGCLTAAGFTEAIRTRHIRTVINLMEEDPDPDLSTGYFDTTPVRESVLCARLGAKFVSLTVDLLSPDQLREHRPAGIDTFLELMDNPQTYPVLMHCRAGLHRTGVMTAVYRMEYDGWTPGEAMSELRSNGFGEFAATRANEYIAQYILSYRAGQRRAHAVAGRAVPGHLMALPRP